jgi:hypothetical protein
MIKDNDMGKLEEMKDKLEKAENIFLEKEESIRPKKKSKPKEKPLTEERFNEILGEHYFAMEDLVKSELNHTCYRIYNGMKVEMRKWNTGYYEK